MTMNTQMPFCQRNLQYLKDLFVTLVKAFQALSNITKNSILGVNAVLDSAVASNEFLLILLWRLVIAYCQHGFYYCISVMLLSRKV